jgi:hypothetical protein
MMPTLPGFLLLLISISLGFGCKSNNSPIPANDDTAFNAYWNQGKAEISSFELNQSRYGANHNGQAVMVFVTEDFSKSKHVKLEDPRMRKSDAIRIMKCNWNKEFVTGVYQYNMMSSVFTPIDYEEYPQSLKQTVSSQEWCGQSYFQSNWKGNRFEVQQFSYFENEGDSKYSLGKAWLEDELWIKIRVAPHTLPIGEVKMIASPLYLRLSHKENKVYEAEASLQTYQDHYTYAVHYPELQRTLEIDFKTEFPHQIMGWKESYGNNEVTTGRLLNTIMSDYWMHNQPQDEILRDQLDLAH